MAKLQKFKSEQEEAAFWDNHDSTEFLDETEAVEVTFIDARKRKKQISLRMDQAIIDQLKIVASSKGLGYQTMIRMWVMERLSQENRPLPA